jgi:hypothetical protein
MKYIIFENYSGLQYPIIFPNFIQHCDIVRKIEHRPISAGFIIIKNNKYEIYGKSVSLNLYSKPSDESLLNCNEA